MFLSNVCRIIMNSMLADWVDSMGAGMHLIPEGMLDPRQIEIDVSRLGDAPVNVVLKEHRGSLITVVSKIDAKCMVDIGMAKYLPQKALVYTMKAYLDDPDIQGNHTEFDKADSSGDDLVLVAIIGESRSALSVCRNIASGCQDMTKVVKDAKGAMSASNVFLVED